MKVLVLNCGSSSIKYKLIEMETKNVLASGGVEKIGLPDSFLKLKLPNGEKMVIEKLMPQHMVGIELILSVLIDEKLGCIRSLKEIDAVGHRVVHGGEKFSESVIITPEVIKDIEKCSELAPLHNPANLEGIAAITHHLPGVPQVAVFDTAFHQTMPDYCYLYALPYELYEKYGIRRYGFHGTSHRYISQRVCEFLGVKKEDQKIITVHIGAGGSVAAILNGKSFDTSMGLTPLEGLVMGTRCGDLDIGAAMLIMEKEKLTPAEFSNICNKKSGLLGVSGISSDARDIEAEVRKGSHRARLTQQVFIHRVLKYIGAYAVEMGGVDIIAFAGGIGENNEVLRTEIAANLGALGAVVDIQKSLATRGEEIEISSHESKVKVCVIPTDEEWMIASDTQALVCK